MDDLRAEWENRQIRGEIAHDDIIPSSVSDSNKNNVADESSTNDSNANTTASSSKRNRENEESDAEDTLESNKKVKQDSSDIVGDGEPFDFCGGDD